MPCCVSKAKMALNACLFYYCC
uniref:Uncharacterized protein n=1 Tax=Arundo donax TaxID=35708 RepID=A0A0A8ZYJ2_ARUDO